MVTASDNDDDWLGDEVALPAGASEASRMHDDIPVTGYNRGEPTRICADRRRSAGARC